jgi:hypothetical protein
VTLAAMNDYRTVFASLDDFEKGSIETIDDERKRYALSNVFEVAQAAEAYEKIVVGRHLDYVIEVLRADGESPWFAASHDEFALVMDGRVRIDLAKLGPAQGAAHPRNKLHRRELWRGLSHCRGRKVKMSSYCFAVTEIIKRRLS